MFGAVRGVVPDFLSITVSNVLVIGGTILLLMGLEQFVYRSGRQTHNIILLAVFVIVHTLILFAETLVSTLDKNNIERARQISGRMRESALQSLKEIRLLLYQTQTSVKGRDLNLIQELNARLANVELRAGVRAEIIEEGSLQYCPEAWHENLFWITIVARNNLLKHAQFIIRCFQGGKSIVSRGTCTV